MNYIGSKKKLLPFIEDVINNNIGDISNFIFCDGFAGTGVVGNYFKNKCKQIISNDIEYYSYVINCALLKTKKEFKNEVNELNTEETKEGFIYKNYSGERNYFTKYNAKRIDFIRNKIEEISNTNEMYFYLLACLLEASDKIANVASVYGAFLKKIKKTAEKQINLIPIDTINDKEHLVFNTDILNLISSIKCNILYLDPPYNSRQYGANYHLLNTIAKYKEFEPSGKTGLPDYYKSNFCKKNQAYIDFEEIIKLANTKYILLSYNNEGIISQEYIKETMNKYGKLKIFEKDYNRFKADNNRKYKTNKTIEYLFMLEKNNK